MSLAMDYGTIFEVMDSWEQLRRMDNSAEIAGTILFQHLFRSVPEAKTLFGFPIDMDPQSDAMSKSKRFLKHASYMIEMLDRALNMLGPDAELLGEILNDLGKKHARFGVKAKFFPFMGEALIATLKETLGASFTPEIEESWLGVYEALSSEMIKSMCTEQAVLDSWATLKTVKHYDEKAGVLLFQAFFRSCPEAKALFGFPIDMDIESDALMKSRRFTLHAKYFIEMLDRALSMVKAETLEENMKELGNVHVSYGVKPEFFPIMGDALFYTLEMTLPEGTWNEELRAAWGDLYARLASQIISAMKNSSVK